MELPTIWVDIPGRFANGPFRVYCGGRFSWGEIVVLFDFDEAARLTLANGGRFCDVTCQWQMPEDPGSGLAGPRWCWGWKLWDVKGTLVPLWEIGAGCHREWPWVKVQPPACAYERVAL